MRKTFTALLLCCALAMAQKEDKKKAKPKPPSPLDTYIKEASIRRRRTDRSPKTAPSGRRRRLSNLSSDLRARNVDDVSRSLCRKRVSRQYRTIETSRASSAQAASPPSPDLKADRRTRQTY